MTLSRTTVAGDASVTGVGLFTAHPAAVIIRPGADGLVFRRVDLPGAPLIPARIEFAIDLPGLPPGMQARNTTLAAAPTHPGAPPAFVATTEHLLSALAGAGITDALIEINGPEVPIVDGSAAPFAHVIAAAGRRTLGPAGPRPAVGAPLTVSNGPATITATPHDRPTCRLEYRLDYGPGAPLAAQTAVIELGDDPGAGYGEQVAPARTYCLAAEAQAMRAMGLFGHITTREMLVIGPDGRPIDQEWRLPDEPARHKLLDLIGDLVLAGPLPRASIVAHRSGHALNQAMARELARTLR